MKIFKKIKKIYESHPQRVGDGFVGKNAISTHNYNDFNPFLMLDHHGPMLVSPSETPKGVDEHPHRGIETVTLVFEGALQHRDSAGNTGKLFAGDMQWMSAAGGIVHEEKHELEFSKAGGILNFIQLWTNLPKKFKMTPPRYQEISANQIPQKNLTENTIVRVFAGDLAGLQGAALTYMPLVLAEIKIAQADEFELDLPQGFNLGLYNIKGQVTVNEGFSLSEGKIMAFGNEGDFIKISAKEAGHLLLLGGEPILEPIVSYGPFVMNTQEEIRQTIYDYQMGKMGHL
jgi:quercetin 2,3-dioxygenase